MPSKTWSELLNDAEAEGGGFTVIPEDDYDLVIVKSEAKKTQKNNKDMFVIQAKVVDGPSKGRVVFNNFVISPESPVSLRIFFQQMRVLGLTGENLFNSNPSPEQIASALYGKVFRGTIKIEKDNKDQDRNVIKNFTTIPEAELGRVQAAAQALLSSSGSVGSATPSAPSTPSAPAAAPPAPAPSAPAPAAPAPAPAAPAPEAPAEPAPAPAPPAAPAAPSGSIPPPPPAPQF